MSNNESLTSNEIIALMTVYVEQWKYRDELKWNIAFKSFYAILVTIVIPFFTERLGINDILLSNSLIIFPLFGIVMALVFLIICLMHENQIWKLNQSYKEIQNMLPSDVCKRLTIEHIIYKPKKTMAMIFLMYVSLIMLGIWALTVLLRI